MRSNHPQDAAFLRVQIYEEISKTLISRRKDKHQDTEADRITTRHTIGGIVQAKSLDQSSINQKNFAQPWPLHLEEQTIETENQLPRLVKRRPTNARPKH